MLLDISLLCGARHMSMLTINNVLADNLMTPKSTYKGRGPIGEWYMQVFWWNLCRWVERVHSTGKGLMTYNICGIWVKYHALEKPSHIILGVIIKVSFYLQSHGILMEITPCKLLPWSFKVWFLTLVSMTTEQSLWITVCFLVIDIPSNKEHGNTSWWWIRDADWCRVTRGRLPALWHMYKLQSVSH